MTSNILISPPHRHDGNSVTRMMLLVCVALIPALICYIIFFGWGILFQCLLAVGFAVSCEYFVLKIRKQDTQLFLKDGSAIVTGLLFAFTISPLTPWWITFSGIFFGIVFAKHLYGGLGYNPFNPAMAGYVFVLLCFPVQMTIWPASLEQSISITEYLSRIFQLGQLNIDAISGATPLSQMKSQLSAMGMVSEIMTDPIYGNFGGADWEWINFSFLLGGIALLALKVIKWQIPIIVLASLFSISLLFNVIDSDIYASPLFHIFSGGTIFCAFFIATDPVTSSTTPTGKIIYAVLIGIIAYVIRTWAAYPDGIAFAVLLANAAVPLIDKVTRPMVFGETHT